MIMSSVFIIDDDESIRTLYERFFSLKGFDLKKSAKNGIEAIEIFKNFSIKPDIIIMDYLMPGLNGLEASKKILEINPETKIIMVSSDSTIKKKSLYVGVKHFLPKTSPLAELLTVVKETIKNSK